MNSGVDVTLVTYRNLDILSKLLGKKASLQLRFTAQ